MIYHGLQCTKETTWYNLLFFHYYFFILCLFFSSKKKTHRNVILQRNGKTMCHILRLNISYIYLRDDTHQRFYTWSKKVLYLWTMSPRLGWMDSDLGKIYPDWAKEVKMKHHASWSIWSNLNRAEPKLFSFQTHPQA